MRNVKKDKKLPNTKTQPKYLGPFDVESITKSHLVTVKDNTQNKVVYPIHMSKKYIQRETQVHNIFNATKHSYYKKGNVFVAMPKQVYWRN